MNDDGSLSSPLSTPWAQNWRESWNCSLTVMALETSTPPSAVFGV